MATTMTHDEVYAKVRGVLVDALGVDEDDVKPDAVIRDDLGAESIDFLDIMFRLEKAFSIKIPKGEMLPDNVAADPKIVKGDMVTPEGIIELKKRLPYSDFTAFERDPKLENMSKLFTVEMIVKYVQSKLAV